MIVWRHLDVPGHEACRLTGQTLQGVAVIAEPPAALTYRVECDEGWRTRRVSVHGWIDEREVHVELESRDLLGCVDIDLNFSPSTNTLPIRRLGLAVGESATVAVAWLRFPDMTLERLEQTYRRLGVFRWEYASGEFRADVEVDSEGLVTRYGGFWVRE